MIFPAYQVPPLLTGILRKGKAGRLAYVLYKLHLMSAGSFLRFPM